MPRNAFAEAYQRGRAAWDVAFPQPAIVAVAASPGFRGPVLDLGCGTGENALFLAALGFSVTGVDLAPLAIQAARRKARERELRALFRCGDALRASFRRHAFGAVIDSGFFHGLPAAERRRYWRRASSLLSPGGRLCILGFSAVAPSVLAAHLAEAPAAMRLGTISPTYFLLAGRDGVVPVAATVATFTASGLSVTRRPRIRPPA